MRWMRGWILVGGLALLATPARAQDVLGGDVAGFGPNGLSNGFGYGVNGGRGDRSMSGLGYRMRQLGMRGYWTGLYYPSDAGNGPGVYYLPTFSSLNGTPSPRAEANGWGYSPPWSKAYRQGEPRVRRTSFRQVFGRHKG